MHFNHSKSWKHEKWPLFSCDKQLKKGQCPSVCASVRNAFSNMLNMVKSVTLCQSVVCFSKMLFMVRLRIKRVQGNTFKCFQLKDQLFWKFLFSPFVRVKASIEGRVCISTTVKVGEMKNGPFLAATSSSRKDNVRPSVRPYVCNAFSNMLNKVKGSQIM